MGIPVLHTVRWGLFSPGGDNGMICHLRKNIKKEGLASSPALDFFC